MILIFFTIFQHQQPLEPGNSNEIRLNAIPINVEPVTSTGGPSDVKITPVLQSVSQMKNFWVLTNLIQGSNVYTIPKIEGSKPGEHDGPTTIIQSTDHQQFILNNPINIGPNQTITIPTSMVESGSNIISHISTSQNAGQMASDQQSNIHLQVVGNPPEKNLNEIQHTQSTQVQYHHPEQPIQVHQVLNNENINHHETIQIIKPEFKHQSHIMDVRAADGSIVKISTSNLPEQHEMLKVNIEDLSQFLSYHEVFGKLPGELLTTSATNIVPSSSSSSVGGGNPNIVTNVSQSNGEHK